MAILISSTSTNYFRLKVPESHPFYEVLVRFLIDHAVAWAYDPRTRRWERKADFFLYSRDSGIVRIPIGFQPKVMELANIHGHEVFDTPEKIVNPRLAEYELKPGYEPRPYQVDPVHELSRIGGPARQGLQLQTGKGKTFITIASLVNHHSVGMIICAGLVDQWVNNLLEYTTIDPEDVCIIQTRKSLDDLFTSGRCPKVFICSLATMRLYALGTDNYQDVALEYPQFLHAYGIGIKVVDEVHLNVHAVALIDLLSPVRYNWYLTATFKRTAYDMHAIFDAIYPHGIKIAGVKYDRYAALYYQPYSADVPDRKTTTNRGYSQARYESYLHRRSRKLEAWFELIANQLDTHFLRIRNEGEKALVFFALVESVMQFAAFAARRFPQLKINTYTGSDTNDRLDNVDLIVSTPKKCGVGTDISALRTSVCIYSTGSPELIEQMFGRLRKLENNVEPRMVVMYDYEIGAQNRHQQTHEKTCRDKAVRIEKLPAVRTNWQSRTGT